MSIPAPPPLHLSTTTLTHDEELFSTSSSLPLALFLTTLSGLATVLGAFIVCLQPNGMTGRSLGLAQGMAAGFMLAVTLLEVIPEALGGVEVSTCVSLAGAGAASIFLLKHLLPEPDLSVFLGQQSDGGGGEMDGRKGGGNAAGSGGVGFYEKRGTNGSGQSRNRNSSSSPSSGAGGESGSGASSSNGSSTNHNQQQQHQQQHQEQHHHYHFRRVPSQDVESSHSHDDGSHSPNESGRLDHHTTMKNSCSSSSSSTSLPMTLLEKQHRNTLLWSGLKIALSLSLHNFPEGIATFAASLKGLEFGLPLTLAIALHNLPEGAACAIPVYVATRSRRKAILVALLSGMAEPVGVLFVAWLGPSSMTPGAVASLLAGVGGVMVGLSVFELGPQAVELTSKREAVMAGGVGFAVMGLVLGVLHV